MMANALIAPWFIEQVRTRIAEQNSKRSFDPQVPANRGGLLNKTLAQNCPAARAQNGAAR
jgi:hypothetical protein